MISIIVPIYNAEQYLAGCLDSLLAQTESDIQIILIDDASTDNSLALAQAYAAKDARIEVHQQAHAGQSAARNKGFRYAKGEFIAYVDADDRIAPDWCAQHLQAIEGVDYVQSGKTKNQYRFTVVWNRLYRRQVIEKLNFQEGMIYEDVLWSVDLWLSGARCRMLNYDGYLYTSNPNSTTSRKHPAAQRHILRLLKERAKTASGKGKWIVWYTIIRLKLHFMKS